MKGNNLSAKKLSVGILLGLVSATLVIATINLAPDFYRSFEAKTLDLRFRFRQPIPQSKDIIFLEMDAVSIQSLGRWPWSRDIFARIVQTLQSLKARSVLFDVIFSEPSQPSIDKDKLEQGRPWKEALVDNDALFADSVKKAANVYLGCHFDIIHDEQDILRAARFVKLKKGLLEWIIKNPTATFKELPGELKEGAEFSKDELRSFFNEVKLQYIISRNFELTFDDVLPYFEGEKAPLLRSLFYNCKAEALREMVKQTLKEKEGISLPAFADRLGIYNPADLQLLKNIYQQEELEDAFAERAGILFDGQKRFYEALRLTPAIMPLAEAMKGAGHINAMPDSDGILRRAPLFISYNGRLYPHIALRVACDYLGIDFRKDIRMLKNNYLMLGALRIPVDRYGCVLINWAGKWQDSFQHLPIVELYQLWELEQVQTREPTGKFKDKLEDERTRLSDLIKDKICIIGLTAPGTHDFLPTSLDANFPAVGTHGALINSILQGKFLSRLDQRSNYAFIFISAIITAFLVSLLPAVTSLFWFILAAFSYCVLSLFIFSRYGIWIDIFGPLSAGLVSFVGIVSYNFATEEKEKRWVRKAFSRYISKNVMEQILRNPAGLQLGGESRELSLMFVDVRNFTAYSEKHRPKELLAILNEYLDEMTKVIFKHDGTLDKYVGDEIMVIFGAPSPQPDHARRAVVVALEMMECLHRLQKKWSKEGREPFDIGIGINTGRMVVGNMGSSERMSYTVIGDAVNLAARIQALTREFNNHIMISEFTYAQVKGMFEIKELSAIKVKGKEEPVMMYEVLA